MTIRIENFANFDLKFDIINNVMILLSIKTHFEQHFSPAMASMGTIGKSKKVNNVRFGTHVP